MPNTTTVRPGASTDAKRNGNGNDLSPVDTLSLDPAVFEKLYLNPQTEVKHDLAKTFAVPTPLALVGISIALTPLSCCLMGWRGADQQKLGNADIGAYLWFGGFCVIISALMEFILGNTYSFVLFMGYGSWFLTYGATLQPFYNAAGAYATNYPANATQDAIQELGESSPGFPASFGFVVVFMALFTFIMLICSTRINIVLVVDLSSILIGFLLIAAALFVENQAALMGAEALDAVNHQEYAAAEELTQAVSNYLKFASRLTTGGGAALFVASLMNWYLLLATLLLAVDFPILIGVYDLSTIVPTKSEIEAQHRNKKEAKFRELEEERIRLEQELLGVRDANARGRAHLTALEKTIAELREQNNLLAIKESGGAKQK